MHPAPLFNSRQPDSEACLHLPADGRLNPFIRSVTRYSFIHGRTVEYSLDRIKGLMIGIGLGDALGLPAETLSHEQIASHFGRLHKYESLETNRFFRGLGKLPGAVSDDFILSHAVAQSLIRRKGFFMPDQAELHVKALLSEPDGFGSTTREALLRFAAGTPWKNSGRTDSPERGNGNGIPMKVGPLAVYHALRASSKEEVIQSVVDLCALTHATPMSVSAGLSQTFGVMYCFGVDPHLFSAEEFMQAVVDGSEIGKQYYTPSLVPHDITDRMKLLSSKSFTDTTEIINTFGKGTCYVYDSLPFTYAFFLRQPHRFDSLIDVINAGGDTDSNGSMLGALLGALHGRAVFPRDLVKSLSVRKIATDDAMAIWKGFS